MNTVYDCFQFLMGKQPNNLGLTPVPWNSAVWYHCRRFLIPLISLFVVRGSYHPKKSTDQCDKGWFMIMIKWSLENIIRVASNLTFNIFLVGNPITCNILEICNGIASSPLCYKWVISFRIYFPWFYLVDFNELLPIIVFLLDHLMVNILDG